MNRSTLLLVFVSLLVGVCESTCGAAQDSTTDKRVAVLIERMVKPDTEQKAFSDLEALGCRAPQRSYGGWMTGEVCPIQESLSVTNPQTHSKGFRHYGPQQVVDALAAILNQITAQDFGFIYNGRQTMKGLRLSKGGGISFGRVIWRPMQGWLIGSFIQIIGAFGLNNRLPSSYQLNNIPHS